MNRTEYQKAYRQHYKKKVRQVKLTLTHKEYRLFNEFANKENTKVPPLRFFCL